jgi:hypothetical protein
MYMAIVWGTLLAKANSMMFDLDPDRIRKKAAKIAIYFILLAISSLCSATLMYWGVAQVLCNQSVRIITLPRSYIAQKNVALI